MATRSKSGWCALGALGWALLAPRLAWADAAPAGAAAVAPRASSAVDSGASATPAWARAYAQGHWSIAADLIETVPEPSRTPWHWLHLARAREKRGQLVEAFAAYERLREMAPLKEAGLDQRLWRLQAEAETEALLSRIPWAQIDLGAQASHGDYVFVDQQWLVPGRVQSPYPVNPGWHTFLLESEGVVVAAQRVHFEEGQRRPVMLHRLQAINVAAVQPEGASTSSRQVSWSPAARGRVVEDAGRDNLRTATYLSLGVGALGIVVGTGFAIVALDKHNQLVELGTDCRGATCFASSSEFERAQRLHEGLTLANDVATASFVVGGLGLAAGGVLYLLQLEDDPTPAVRGFGVEVEPLIGVGAAGVAGRF